MNCIHNCLWACTSAAMFVLIVVYVCSSWWGEDNDCTSGTQTEIINSNINSSCNTSSAPGSVWKAVKDKHFKFLPQLIALSRSNPCIPGCCDFSLSVMEQVCTTRSLMFSAKCWNPHSTCANSSKKTGSDAHSCSLLKRNWQNNPSVTGLSKGNSMSQWVLGDFHLGYVKGTTRCVPQELHQHSDPSLLSHNGPLLPVVMLSASFSFHFLTPHPKRLLHKLQLLRFNEVATHHGLDWVVKLSNKQQ